MFANFCSLAVVASLLLHTAAAVCSGKFQQKDGPGGFGTSYRVGTNRKTINKIEAATPNGFDFFPAGLPAVTSTVRFEHYTAPTGPMVKVSLEIDNTEHSDRSVQVAFFDNINPDPFWLLTVTGKNGVPATACGIAAAPFVNNHYMTIQAF